jgi:hypothetical protein
LAEVGRRGEDVAGESVDDGLGAEVSIGVFGEESLLSRFNVDGEEGGFVAVVVVDEEKGFSVGRNGGDTDDAGTEGGSSVAVVVVEGAEGLPFVVGGGAEQIGSAGLAASFGDARDELGVAVDFAEVVVLEDRLALAGGQVDSEQVELRFVTDVDGDEGLVGVFVAEAFESGLDVFFGGEVEGLAGVEIDSVEVAGVVGGVEGEEVFASGGPVDIEGDGFDFRGDGLGILEIVNGGEEELTAVVFGFDEGEMGGAWADFGGEVGWVGE